MGHGTDYNLEDLLSIVSPKTVMDIPDDKLMIEASHEISIEENDQSTFINKTYSNRRIRSIRFLNKFRKTEFNRFPLIELNKKTITILSRVFSYFYTNKKLNHDFS